MKTRLDPVVRFREQKELRALERLGRAVHQASQAQRELTGAQSRASQDARGAGAAADWAMAEVARERVLVEVKRAQAQLALTSTAVEAARGGWSSEHRQTEVVRRVATVRRREATQAQARQETAQFDELGSLLHWRQRL